MKGFSPNIKEHNMQEKYSHPLQSRAGVVAIIIANREPVYNLLNEILHEFSSIIIGRMGIPYREKGLSIIALIIDGTTDQIGAMTGKIGQLPNVIVKSVLAPDKH
jgi:putative iron-only hydrogenase system regulator